MSADQNRPVAEQSGSSVFAPSAAAPASFGSVLRFLLSLVLVFGGFWVMSLAFSYEGWGAELFVGGLLLDALGLWLAFGLTSRSR